MTDLQVLIAVATIPYVFFSSFVYRHVRNDLELKKLQSLVLAAFAFIPVTILGTGIVLIMLTTVVKFLLEQLSNLTLYFICGLAGVEYKDLLSRLMLHMLKKQKESMNDNRDG